MSERFNIFQVAAALIQQAGESYRREGNISKNLWVSLHSLFGDLLRSALDIVDRKRVIRLQRLGAANQSLKLYMVKGHSNAKYFLKKHAHFCSCPAFKYQVVGGSALTCKHLLALALAEACDIVVDHKLQQREMMMFLKKAY